jgi:glycosyltransferase involved in cell wall biosynthesis
VIAMNRQGYKYRLAVVDSNPIQYKVPLWREIAKVPDIDQTVFFASDLGLRPVQVKGFGASWVWDVPITDGYKHEFLKSVKLPLFPRPGGNVFPLGLFWRLLQGNYDAILIQGYRSACYIPAVAAALMAGIPLFVRSESHGEGGTNSLKAGLKRVLLRWLARRVAVVLAIGSWNRRHWRSAGVPEERILDAPYAVDNEAMQAAIDAQPKEVARIRSAWGAQTGDVVFLFAGRLIESKGPALLLEAFAALAPRGRCHLVFVGDGPLQQSLREQAKAARLSNVHFAGFVNQSALPYHYAAADVFVLPSFSETWGLVVNEAMACGLPVVVTDAMGCSPDLVEQTGAGIVVRARFVEELMGALDKMMEPEIREHAASLARRAIKGYTFAKSAAAVHTALELVCSQE